MKQQNDFIFNNTPLLFAFLLIFFWLLLLRIIQYFFGHISIEKIPKQELVNYYEVDKKTINKWVKYFCKDAINYANYKQQRKLDLGDYLTIIMVLGSPDEYPVFTKQAIITKCEGTYSSLRDSIDKYPERYGIDGTTYRCLHKFPPSISQQIMQQFD